MVSLKNMVYESLLLEKYDSAEDEYFFRESNSKWTNRKAQEKLMTSVEKEIKQKSSDLHIPKDSKDHDVLDTYASVQYKDINGQLRKGKVSAKYQKIVDQIDQIITQNKLNKDLIVYRGVEESAIRSSDKAFKSCSISPIVASNFVRGGAKLFRFKIPKGINYSYIGGGEYEILFSRDLDLQKFLY
jgi:hypothetical protein